MNKIKLGIVLLMLIEVAYGISISCPECYLGDCGCSSDCSSGLLDIYETGCEGPPDYEKTISDGEVVWSPSREGTYYLKVLCDNEEQSGCISIEVTSPTTTTSTTTTIRRRPRPRPRRTTTTIKSTTSTSITTTTLGECIPVGCGDSCKESCEDQWNSGECSRPGFLICVENCPDCPTTTIITTSTTVTTTLITTTTRPRPTTTTIPVCNRDSICDLSKEENHFNCPQDCPSGSEDNYCDGLEDGICDPDCGRMQDPDCSCNNDNSCEMGTENYLNCPQDCPSGSEDNYCDGLEDGICDPDCMAEEDPDCGKEDYSQYINYLLYVVLFIIIIFVIVLFYKKIKEREQMEKAKADYKEIKRTREIKKEVDHKKIKEKKQTGKETAKNEMLEWAREKLKGGEDPAVLKNVLEDEGYDPEIVDKAMRHLQKR